MADLRKREEGEEKRERIATQSCSFSQHCFANLLVSVGRAKRHRSRRGVDITHQHFIIVRHIHSHTPCCTFFATVHLQTTMRVKCWTGFFHGSRKRVISHGRGALTVARSHGSDAGAESHSARVRAVGGAIAATLEANSTATRSLPFQTAGIEIQSQQQQLNKKEFNNVKKLSGGKEQ